MEATGTAGGRICTQRWQQFDHGIEYGAEFIHGDAPLTFELLKKADVPYTKVTGNMISVRHGVRLPESQQEMYHNTLLEKLELIQDDCSIQDFLDAYLPKEEYEQTRNSVQQFAEGFGLCDITKASILALKKEWKNLEADQYRIEDGYIKLINYLVQTCTHPLGTFHFYTAVNQIDYQPGQVIVHTVNGCRYTSPRIIVTVSAGVLQAGDIRFDPPLREHGVAIQQLPFGSVI